MGINFKEPRVQHLNIKSVPVDVLRLDTIHPVVSGNKWYKLKGHLDYMAEHNIHSFVTFGGPYSNHLHAAAYAAKAYGIKATAFVRGVFSKAQYSDTLKACIDMGMQLEFIDRSSYRLKHTPEFVKWVNDTYPNSHIIPEGGSGDLGQRGLAMLQAFIENAYTDIVVSVGSGTTLQGIAALQYSHQQLWGFVPMKNGAYIHQFFKSEYQNVHLIDDYHFGGFGKYDENLIRFMNELYLQYQIPTDMVYTSKLFYGLNEMIEKGIFSDKKILAIHTGGLQGNQTIIDRLIF